MTRGPVRYVAQLSPGKTALWCFLIWYVATVIRHFDPAPSIWLNALGISGIVGIALYLSVREPGRAPDRWTTLRLFIMPFCVSSFSQLIKGRGFVLVFPPDRRELVAAAGACAVFVVAVLAIKRLKPASAA
jgi:hypothetical protein